MNEGNPALKGASRSAQLGDSLVKGSSSLRRIGGWPWSVYGCRYTGLEKVAIKAIRDGRSILIKY